MGKLDYWKNTYPVACVVNRIAKLLSHSQYCTVLYCILYCSNTRAYNVHFAHAQFPHGTPYVANGNSETIELLGIEQYGPP